MRSWVVRQPGPIEEAAAARRASAPSARAGASACSGGVLRSLPTDLHLAEGDLRPVDPRSRPGTRSWER